MKPTQPICSRVWAAEQKVAEFIRDNVPLDTEQAQIDELLILLRHPGQPR